jgi:hypothetical protein
MTALRSMVDGGDAQVSSAGWDYGGGSTVYAWKAEGKGKWNV